MSTLYHDHELLQKGKITRREFFKKVVAAGIATPAILSFLQGCATQAPAPPVVDASQGSAVKYSRPEGITKEIAHAG